LSLFIVAAKIGLELGGHDQPVESVSFQGAFQIRSRVERRRLHRDMKVGRLDVAMEMIKQGTTNFEDIIQVVVGASALCVPVAFSEEAWNLGRTLPVANIIVLVALSLLFVNLYSLHNIFQGRITHRIFAFFARTFIDYSITLLVVVVVMSALNHLPIFS